MTTILIIALLLGILLVLGGAFSLFAQGMSDSPSESDPRGSCLVIAGGTVLFLGSVITLIVRAC